ncbi:MAG: hypothetical protein IKP67_02270 [Spirochaetales bacterium]|nr:hypothetical protein [Spirochaetales bacterium]
MHEQMLQKNDPKHNTIEETPPEMTIVRSDAVALPESQPILYIEDHSDESSAESEMTENEDIIENEDITIEEYGADNGGYQPSDTEECDISEQIRLDEALSDTEIGKSAEDRD